MQGELLMSAGRGFTGATGWIWVNVRAWRRYKASPMLEQRVRWIGKNGLRAAIVVVEFDAWAIGLGRILY